MLDLNLKTTLFEGKEKKKKKLISLIMAMA